ncbi:MAG: NAD-dependent 4,6-dehydratase LegB [Salibacteraceae bacterium]
MSNKRAFITGADGFIGSHLTQHLVELGMDVTALAQYNSFGNTGWLERLPESIKPNVNIVFGDIRDGEQMEKLASDCNYIFHLAALIAIPYSYEAPRSYIDTNIIGTHNLLQAAQKNNVERSLIISTSEVYGTARTVPITEEHPLQAQSPYSASKISAEKLAQSYHLSFDLPLTVVRPFNTFGPRQSVRAVVPSLILQMVKGEKTIKLGNTTPTRDLVYVKDTVMGMAKIASSDAAVGQVVNIATENEISIGDLAHKIATLLKLNVSIVQDEERLRPESSEVFRLLGSAQKLVEYTGWKPSTSLEQGLMETIDWFSKPNNIDLYKHSFLK